MFVINYNTFNLKLNISIFAVMKKCHFFHTNFFEIPLNKGFQSDKPIEWEYNKEIKEVFNFSIIMCNRMFYNILG